MLDVRSTYHAPVDAPDPLFGFTAAKIWMTTLTVRCGFYSLLSKF
jgi:hypothetical protein